MLVIIIIKKKNKKLNENTRTWKPKLSENNQNSLNTLYIDVVKYLRDCLGKSWIMQD